MHDSEDGDVATGYPHRRPARPDHVIETRTREEARDDLLAGLSGSGRLGEHLAAEMGGVDKSTEDSDPPTPADG